MKKILLTPEQSLLYYDFLFVKSYLEKNNKYPRFRALQNEKNTVGYYLPNHPKSNIQLKTYVEKYLKNNLDNILNFLVAEKGEVLPKVVGEKSYLSRDRKTLLRSEFESIAHNIFYINNLSDKIEVDSQRFYKSCRKFPDFVWEDRKMIIEIAGREDEEYWNKISEAEKCFKSLGYKVVIIDSRKYEKRAAYKDFYLDFCNLIGLPVDKKIEQNPYQYLTYLNVDNDYMKKYIDEKVCKVPKTSNENRILNQFIKRIYGIGLKEYQQKIDCPRYRSSIPKSEILKYKEKNPNLTNREIANYFGKSKNTIQSILSKK